MSPPYQVVGMEHLSLARRHVWPPPQKLIRSALHEGPLDSFEWARHREAALHRRPLLEEGQQER
eukprot:6177753-Pleurochrysis_carterae.AAC.3